MMKSIHEHTLHSNLLHLIGHAEMEREIQKTVTKIIQNQDSLETPKLSEIELDEKELRKTSI